MSQKKTSVKTDKHCSNELPLNIIQALQVASSIVARIVSKRFANVNTSSIIDTTSKDNGGQG